MHRPTREPFPPTPKKPEYPVRGFVLIAVVVAGFVLVHYLGGWIGGVVIGVVVILLAIPSIRSGWREGKRRARDEM